MNATVFWLQPEVINFDMFPKGANTQTVNVAARTVIFGRECAILLKVQNCLLINKCFPCNPVSCIWCE